MALAMSTHVWDRAMFCACREHTLQLQKALRIHHDATVEAQAVEHVCAVCKPEDTRLVQWTAFEDCSDTVVVWPLLIIFEALRNGFSLLASNLTEWFIEVTVFEDAAGLLSAELFWLLDLDAAIMEIAVELQLRHGSAHIRVAARHRSDPGAFQRFELVVFHAGRFVKVADSRWHSLGNSCRAVLGSLFLALLPMIA